MSTWKATDRLIVRRSMPASICWLASGCASPPQRPSRRISPINTCTHRDPSGSLSFGPRRNDSAVWTTTRHIDLTLSISSPMFFPSLAGVYLFRRCPLCEAFLQPCASCQLAAFLDFVSTGVFLPATPHIIDSPHQRLSPDPARETTRPCTGISFG